MSTAVNGVAFYGTLRDDAAADGYFGGRIAALVWSTVAKSDDGALAGAQALIARYSTVPRYWFKVALIEKIGRLCIQMIGFFFGMAFMFALAIPYNHWTHKENRTYFVELYSITFFFANFGPNATTFVVPAEIFPTWFRSTCPGISATSGKLGGDVGVFRFLYLAQNQDKTKADTGYPAGIGVRNSLMLLGGVNLLGLLFTFIVPESKGKSREYTTGENVGEDREMLDATEWS
ncbi:hypothetical protein MLD38_033083 [Melastoma candidum]|uniref:Uncharacterized protein n=1 Tax=Melastoma candidum TaxID=119954 RepID=A0ACB9M885_9MYRT|nr:hypothetical protein MLD38_033083 [Melastoma candidum]